VPHLLYILSVRPCPLLSAHRLCAFHFVFSAFKFVISSAVIENLFVYTFASDITAFVGKRRFCLKKMVISVPSEFETLLLLTA